MLFWHLISPPPQFNGKPESGLRGKDGYFIHGLDSTKRSLSNRLVFPSDSAIPAFVGQKLSFLQNKYQSGSVVSILGFNAFNLKDVSQDNINNEIFRAVARNFFISILEKKLVVVCDGEEMTRTALEKVMQDDKCQKRRNSEIEVISGSKSYSDYVTVKTGKKETIGTEYGNFDLHYRLADSDESMRISLYRQGMYITDSMPHNKPAQYGKFKPFNAVISIEDGPKQANKAFQLIRGSEGPKHLEIRAERLLKSDRDQFLGLFRQINEQIRLRCTEESTDEFTPSIFDIVLNSGKSKPPPATTESQTGGSGNATPVDETTDGVGPGNEGGRTNGGGDPIGRKLVRNRCLIKVAAKRDQESIRLIIDSEKTIDGARLYLGVHSGSDATCSSPLNDDPIKFKLVSIDGNVVNSSVAKSKAVGVIERDKPKQISLELLDEVPRDAVIKVSIGNDGAAKR